MVKSMVPPAHANNPRACNQPAASAAQRIAHRAQPAHRKNKPAASEAQRIALVSKIKGGARQSAFLLHKFVADS
jgi:hypothetical protein